MAYWGWRPLVFWLFISVLISACDDAPIAPGPSSTSLPPITLTVRLSGTPPPASTLTAILHTPFPRSSATPAYYHVQPGDSAPRIALNLGINPTQLAAANPSLIDTVPQIGDLLTIPSLPVTASPLNMALQPPTCALTTPDTLQCLGLLHNTTPISVQRVTVRGSLFGDDGRLLASQISTIEQRLLPGSESAPYRLMFAAADYASGFRLDKVSRLVITLNSADTISTGHALLPLAIIAETASESGGVYRFSAALYNPHDIDALDVRVVITVLDEQGRVGGYRTIVLQELRAGESAPLELDINLLFKEVRPVTWSHTVYVEAWHS